MLCRGPSTQETFQTAYWSYFVYESRAAVLQTLVTPEDGFSFCSQQESLGEEVHLVKTEEKEDRAAWERSRAVDREMGLLALLFFSHMRALLSNSSLCKLDHDKLLNGKAVKRLQFSAPEFLLVVATL